MTSSAAGLLLNFKNLILVSLLSFIFGCGVKAPPAKYPETMVDSYVQSYTGTTPTPEELERIKNDEPIQSTTDQTKTISPLPAP